MTRGWPNGDPRDVARAIVADPRFTRRVAEPPAERTWLDAVRDWLVGVLRGVLHAIDRTLGAHSPLDAAIGFAVIGAAFVLFGGAVYVLVRSLLRARAQRGPAAQRAGRDDGVAATAVELRAAAREAARAGRNRAAAALLFRAAVAALDERGRVAYDPARTPGEYRRLVRDARFDAFAADAVVALYAAAEPRGDIVDRMDLAYDRLFDASAP
jgi:hypothetical protein